MKIIFDWMARGRSEKAARVAAEMERKRHLDERIAEARRNKGGGSHFRILNSKFQTDLRSVDK